MKHEWVSSVREILQPEVVPGYDKKRDCRQPPVLHPNEFKDPVLGSGVFPELTF